MATNKSEFLLHLNWKSFLHINSIDKNRYTMYVKFSCLKSFAFQFRNLCLLIYYDMSVKRGMSSILFLFLTNSSNTSTWSNILFSHFSQTICLRKFFDLLFTEAYHIDIFENEISFHLLPITIKFLPLRMYTMCVDVYI